MERCPSYASDVVRQVRRGANSARKNPRPAGSLLKTYQQRSEIPKCTACGALLRPHIYWFGEVPFHMKDVLAALKQCAVFLSIGTSGVVEPAASFAEQAAQNRARTYYVGLEEPANADAFQDVFLGLSGKLLPGLVKSI